jgi:hypothetical protein
MEVLSRYLCCYCRSQDIDRAKLELMNTLCRELELKLKDTEEKLTRTKIEANDKKLRCSTVRHDYEVKLKEKDRMIKQLQVSLKNIQIPDFTQEITEKQKQEHEYLKHHRKFLETKVQALHQENQKLSNEIVKLRKNLKKVKKKNTKIFACSSRQQETQKISLPTQWQRAVCRCDENELSRLMTLVDFKARLKALFWFVKFDNVDLVKLFLDNETKSHIHIQSLLWYSVEKGSAKVCQELVVRKADVNVVDNNGVDLITFCANSTTNQHCKKRLLSILYNAETNNHDMWVNSEGEEMQLGDEGVEDKYKKIVHIGEASKSSDTGFK